MLLTCKAIVIFVYKALPSPMFYVTLEADAVV